MGKLILMFNDISHQIEVNPDDIVISNISYPSIPYDQLIIVNPNDLPLATYRDQLEIAKLKFIENLKDQLQKEAFTSCYNNFYNHIFRSLMKWIYVIDNVMLEKKFDEIVLSDCVDSEFYLPYYEAEGEINGRLFYEIFDFIPHYIKTHLKNSSCKLTIVNKHGKVGLKIRIFLRRYVLLLLKFIISLKNHIDFQFDSPIKEKTLPKATNIFVFLSRGLPHTHYLLPYLNFNNENTLLFVSDGIKSKNKNLRYAKTLDVNAYSYLKFLRWYDYIFVLIRIFVSLLKTSKLPKIGTMEVDLKFSSTLREMLISYYEVELYHIALERFVHFIKRSSNANLVLITAEMFTPFTFVTAKVGQKFQCKTLQLQTSLIDYWPQTSFTNCDKFIFTSSQALNFYKDNNPSEAEKYDYWGVLTEVKENITRNTHGRILYFTQPYENNVELAIVKALKVTVQKMGFELVIKLHPRDSKDKFSSIGENLSFLESTKLLSSYISDFDVVVVRTSAIGKEAIISGIPTIICLFSEADQTIKVDFIQEKYKKYKSFVYNEDQLVNAVLNHDITCCEFDNFRTSFINDNGLNKDVHSFHRSLNSFSIN